MFFMIDAHIKHLNRNCWNHHFSKKLLKFLQGVPTICVVRECVVDLQVPSHSPNRHKGNPEQTKTHGIKRMSSILEGKQHWYHCHIEIVIPIRVFREYTKSQYWHNFQLYIPIYLPLLSLFAPYDVSKLEIRLSGYERITFQGMETSLVKIIFNCTVRTIGILILQIICENTNTFNRAIEGAWKHAVNFCQWTNTNNAVNTWDIGSTTHDDHVWSSRTVNSIIPMNPPLPLRTIDITPIMAEELIINCLIAKPTKDPFTSEISWIIALVIAQTIVLWNQ